MANSAEGHERLVAVIREIPGPVRIGLEATGGQEWVLGATLVAAGIDAGMIARFMQFRPESGRGLPGENLRIPRALTTRRAQMVDMRKRLAARAASKTFPPTSKAWMRTSRRCWTPDR